MSATPASEIDYLKTVYEFVKHKHLIQRSGVRKAMTVLLDGRQDEFLRTRDERVRRVSETRQNALFKFFVKMFDIGSNLRWRRQAMFDGCWRKISHHEIEKATGMTRSQREAFLKALKDHKLISWDYDWDKVTRKNKCLKIMVNFVRLKEMLEQAYEWACNHKLFGMGKKQMVEVEVFADDHCLINQDVIDNVRSSSFSSSGSSELSSGTKKETHPSASPGDHSSFCSKKVKMKVDTNTYNILVHLRTAFLAHEITVSAVKKVHRLANSFSASSLMTEAQVVDFITVREMGDDTWLSKPMELKVFLKLWPGIKKCVHKRLTEDAAFAAQVDLEHYAPANIGKTIADSYHYVVHRAARRVSGNVSEPWECLTSCFGVEENLPDYANSIRMLLNMGFHPGTVIELCRPQLRKIILNSPARIFVNLENEFPLRQWARLTWQECHDLREQAREDSFEDHRAVAVHEVAYV